jgi:carbon storage regulator
MSVDFYGEKDCKETWMLVLTRRAGESIMIDDDIELKVLKIRGSQVHLGIDAPKRSAVHRKEVWLRINGEPKAAGREEKEDSSDPSRGVA